MIENGHLFVASQPKKSETAREISQAAALILLSVLFSVSVHSQIASLSATPETSPAFFERIAK